MTSIPEPSAADFSGADPRQSTFIDSNFAGARLDGADFTGSKWRGVRGMGEREAHKAKGIPRPNAEGQVNDTRGAN
ncbi:MAG: pentapeptide repeat-containing protein [Sterolibacteriaceae bacterium]|nr:pentapeptide repeat-containing protein [Sterolibacteriaceae bacterium]MBK9084515.1 pentapeptide repeat-containing protein [Sterolibacteriaceae bacterium]